VATQPANIQDLSLPIYVNSKLPEPEATSPLMIQTQNEVSVQVVTLNNQVVTVSDETGFRFAVAAVDEAGSPMPIAADGSLVVQRDNWINIAGNGLQPNSTAVAWVFSEPRRLGTMKVLADGSFRQRFRVPEGLPAGGHTTQINGIDAQGDVRSFNLAIEVVNAPITPHQSVQATITSDPVDVMIATPAGDSLRADNTSAYVLLAALLFGGALFVLNGMRLKRRDLEYLRQARRPTQRRTPQRGSSFPGVSPSADRDITGEIFITR
jgi:hypothetical protein